MRTTIHNSQFSMIYNYSKTNGGDSLEANKLRDTTSSTFRQSLWPSTRYCLYLWSWTQGKSCKSYKFSTFHLSFFLLCWSVLWRLLSHNTLIDDVARKMSRSQLWFASWHVQWVFTIKVLKHARGCLRLQCYLGTIKKRITITLTILQCLQPNHEWD